VGQLVGRILDKSGNGNHATQATTSKKPILKRQPKSGIRNLLRDSDNVFAGTIDWASSLTWDRVEVNPYYPGGTSWRLTNDGAISSRNINKSGHLSDGSPVALSVILEKGPGDTVSDTSVSIYNATLAKHDSRVSLNWSSGTYTVVVGTGYATKLADVGPNGGPVYKIVVVGGVPAGDNYTRFVYCCGTDTNTKTVVIHRTQFERGAAATADQITVGGYDVSEAGYDQVYWLDYDGVDDELVSSNPDLGTNATRARATIGGAVIEQGLTLGANLNLSTDNLGLIVINRPLTQDELSALTSYLNSIVGS
jgi:hypothetical protein